MSDLPLVSVQIPTWNRPRFAENAVAQVLLQTYKNVEVLVIDDSDPWKRMRVPLDRRVKYVRLEERTSIGAKRNLANHYAQGEFIVHWDDDDWYSPRRLARQLEPLLLGSADLCGMPMGPILQLPGLTWARFKPGIWAGTPDRGFHDGTIAYTRAAAENPELRFPDLSLAEAMAFIERARQLGLRQESIPNGELFVYVRHEKNAWAFDPMKYLAPTTAPRWFPKEAEVFYRMAGEHVA